MSYITDLINKWQGEFCVYQTPTNNAVVALNELRPGLEYRLLEQKGPMHLPTFVMQIQLNGHIVKAKGKTKKQ